MRQRIAIALALMCIMAIALSTTANAQETGADKAKTQLTAWTFYKLDFNVREMDNGKALNTRSYTMSVRNGGVGSQIRVGTRIPYVGEKGPSYMDVGFDVDCRIEEQAERGQALAISTDLSSLPAEQAQDKNGMPLIRSLRSSSVIPLILNKPILVTSVDEVGSTHRIQVDVTITSLK